MTTEVEKFMRRRSRRNQKKQRLFDIDTQIVSVVDHPANDRGFLIVKDHKSGNESKVKSDVSLQKGTVLTEDQVKYAAGLIADGLIKRKK